MHVRRVREGFDREVSIPAQATNRLAEIGIRRHGSDRNEAERVQIPHTPGRPDALTLDDENTLGLQSLQCGHGLQLIPWHRPIGAEDLQHDSALRQVNTLISHGSYGSCVKPPGC